MDLNLKIGMTFTSRKRIEIADTALEYGSGRLSVFATPAMIALMENAAFNAVLNDLPAGYDTVGTMLDVRHLKPTPVGSEVLATATLTAIEGQKLTFSVDAYDETSKVGVGTHIRYIVDTAEFMNEIQLKAH